MKSEWYGATIDAAQSTSGGPLPICDRCGEEIGLANDLDRAGDIDRRPHLLRVGGKPHRLTPISWRLFTLLYAHRGDVLDYDQLHTELYGDAEQPSFIGKR